MLEKLEKYQIIILAVVLAFGLIRSTKIVTSSLSKETIFVTGSSSKNVISDNGRLEFTIETRTPTKAAAYATLSKQIPQVKEYLKSKGIEDSEIELKTASCYNIYKQLPKGNTSNEIAYYNLSQNIAIKSKDVNKIKDISTDITGLIDKGIDICVMSPEYF